jgi:uncharacterized protein involved in exopolysaccharide biosynthesis
MEDESFQVYQGTPRRAPTLRDIALVCFRHRQFILLTFGAIFLSLLGYVVITPRTYQAETKILVKRERADPVVTPENNASPILTTGVTEEDLNSEVELLKSGDLLERVVITCGLAHPPAYSLVGSVLRTVRKISPEQGNSQLAIPLAVRALERNLKVDAIRKTNLIQVSYASPDPNLAASVLKTLTSLYLEKHLEVHRPPGTFAFFQQEASRYWEGLRAAENKLADFNRAQNTVSAQAEKSAGQQRLAEFTAALGQTRTAIAATEGRIQTLTTQMASTPDRMTTEIRTNSLLLQQLKSTLLTLELKQTELAGKYAAGYVPLREVEAQIMQTKAAIAKEENLPVHDDTTDRNPTYQWMANELAKARADNASLRRQAAATDDQIRAYRSEMLVLDGKDFEQQDLLRAAKIQETNYLLYQNKREEAQISDALDEKHIVNVAVAEAAMTPALPSSRSPFEMLFAGLIVASFVSVGLAFGKEYLNASLRNPDDVRLLLEIPVLASFPKTITGQD